MLGLTFSGQLQSVTSNGCVCRKPIAAVTYKHVVDMI